MRVLKTEVAEERKRKILNWVVHHYVRTSKPVSSELVAEKGGFNISSATIRNVLNELEKNGYLYQPHTSGGRIPTDKGYRSYVDYVTGIQRLAVSERETVEKEYRRRMDETDQLLVQTSKILSVLSKSAGFVLSPDAEDDCIRRIDLIPLGVKSVLAVLVTKSGIVRHWPVSVDYEIDPDRMRALGAFFNHRIAGLTLPEARRILWSDLSRKEAEVKDMQGITRQLMTDLERHQQSSESIYMEGLSRLSENVDSEDFAELRNVLRVVEEKEKLSGILRERLKDCVEGERRCLKKVGNNRLIDVTIGSENEVKEFKNFSLISSTYCAGDKILGLVGILGPKRMEYPRMISLVNTVSEMVSHVLEEWEHSFPSAGAGRGKRELEQPEKTHEAR